jgi:hypothetical protein
MHGDMVRPRDLWMSVAHIIGVLKALPRVG